MFRRKFITRNIFLLGLVSFFTDMSSEMLYPVMPLFFASVGLSAVAMGMIEGVAEAVAGISKSFFGHLGDRLGRPEWFVRIGYGLSAVSKPLLGFVTSPAAFIAIRSADRFGKGIRTAPRDAILAGESQQKVRGRVFGFHRFMDTFGAAVGPLLALVIIAVFSLYDQLSAIFIFALVPGLAAVALTFMVRSHVKKPVVSRAVLHEAMRSYLGIFKPALYTPTYRKLLVGLVLVGIFNSSDAFLLLRASELVGSRQEIFGFPIENAIIVIGLYIIFNIAYALLSLVVGSLADARGYRNTFIAGLVAFAIAYSLLSRELSIGGLLLAFVIYALFAAVNDGLVKAWLSRQLPKERLGTGLGVANTVISLSFLVSSVVTGIIWEVFSSSAALSVMAIGMIVPIAYILMVIPRREPDAGQAT
ncbi:MFS transporter [Candidatus Saccharibacteria bacterium]|nr:MFS transporter [Candidatus Saccharibacteria bacterium]